MKKRFNLAKQWLAMPMLAVMLILSTVLPSIAVAEEQNEIKVSLKTIVGGTQSPITENLITSSPLSGDLEVVLTIEDSTNHWADDILSKEDVLLQGMTADIDEGLWEQLKELISIKQNGNSDIFTDANRKTLTLVIGDYEQYNISDDQIISMYISPILIHEWPGTVTPVDFTIHAKPEISIGGSIMSGSTTEDIQKGLKNVELKLINAKWDENEISKTPNYNKLLDGFKTNNTTWEVTQALKKCNPNEVISYSDDLRTLYIDLPAFEGIVQAGTTTIDATAFSGLYIIDPIDNIGDLTVGLNSFTISASGQPTLTITPRVRESDIRDSNSTKLSFTLENAKWSITKEKVDNLLENMTTKDQPDEWRKVVEKLKASEDYFELETTTVPVDTHTLVINVPQMELNLIKDQTISAKIPYQLLENSVTIPDQRFTIVAQPKAILAGTAVPSLSQTDLAKGDKTVIISLVNAEWNSDVASSTSKRETLLKAFNWDEEILKEINARADVKRTNDRTVTIKLPAITQKFSGTVDFTPNKDILTPKTGAGNFITQKQEKAITVSSVDNQSALVTGTATEKINEFDILKKKQTVVIALKNDSWKNDIESSTDKIKLQVNGSPSDQLGYSEIKRTSDTVATLTLDADEDFDIEQDSTVSIKIPASLLNVRSKELYVDSAFIISAVTADISGNGVSMDPVDVEKGGKSVTITLNNAEFNDVTSSIASIFKHDNLTANSPWSSITDVKVSKNKMTIKFPAVPANQPIDSGKVNIILPGSMIKDAPNLQSKTIELDAGAISIGAIATATFSSSIKSEADIKNGKKTITIELTGATWDPTIVSNKSKKSALLKGFTVADQTKEWNLVTAAVAADGTFTLSSDESKLSILLPEVPKYTIIRNQVVEIAVPKSVLSKYKYDIPLKNKLTIKVPSIDSFESFVDVLESGLSDYIQENGLENVRVKVPMKHVETISTSVSEINGRTIATTDILTTSEVQKVVVRLLSDHGEVEQTIDINNNNKFTFVFDNLAPDTVLQVSAYNQSDELVQDIFKKIAKGNKTYTEIPKTPLDGVYSLYSLLTEKSLLNNILKYYTLEEFKIGVGN